MTDTGTVTVTVGGGHNFIAYLNLKIGLIHSTWHMSCVDSRINICMYSSNTSKCTQWKFKITCRKSV